MTRSLLFLALVGRHLVNHRVRSLLTLFGVALGVAVAVAVQLANHSAMAAFENSVRSVAGEAGLQIVSSASDLDERVVTRLRLLTDSATLSPVVEGLVVVAGHPEQGFRLLGIDLLSPGAFREYGSRGDAAESEVTDPEGLFITHVAATRLGLKAGDSLKLWVNDRERAVRIAGVLPGEGRTRTLDPMVAFADVSVAQELLGRVGRLDRIELLPRDTLSNEALKPLVTPLLGPGEELVEPEESNRQADRMLASFRTNLLALSFVALIVGAYMIYNAIAVSVVQRRREVAILRALGTSRAQIFLLFTLEAGLMGFAGAVLGLGLGAWLSGAAVGAVSQTVNSIYVSTPVEGVVWTPWAFATGIGVGVGLSLVAALWPAFEAAGTSPALAMRPGSWEARQRSRLAPVTAAGLTLLALALLAAQGPAFDGLPLWGYTAAALVILGCSLLAPLAVVVVAFCLAPVATRFGAAVQLGMHNFRQAVGRNAVAVASLMVGMAMMIGVATMVASFRETVTAWVGTTLPAELYLKPSAATGARKNLTLDPALVPAIAKLPGVDAAEAFRNRALTYNGVSIRLGAADTSVLAKHGSLVLRDPGDVRAMFGRMTDQDRVLISETLVLKHGLTPGQPLILPTASGPKPFEVLAVYHDYSTDQGYVMMDLATYRRHWQDPAITDIAVYTKPGADTTALRGQVQTLLAGRPITMIASGDLRKEVLRVFDNTFAITYALHVIAIAVSLLGVISTLFALVLERQRDISLLRYVGLERRQVRTMIMAESGLIGLTGALVGLLAGGLLSGLLIHVINRQSFGWSVQWHPPFGFILGALGALLVASLVAGLIPAAVAARQPIAEGLRRE